MFYIGGPEIIMSISFVLGLGIVLLIFVLFSDLKEAKDPIFALISIICVAFAVYKATSPFICGLLPGVFAMLLYIYLMRKYVW